MSMATVELVWLDGEEKPRGLCWCGCGGTTAIAPQTIVKRHMRAGVPYRYIANHRNIVPLEVRFHNNYQVDAETGCWLWTGYRSRGGYAQISVSGGPCAKRSREGAHRVAHELYKGPIPEGFDVDHLCRNPSCVNPDHLEAVTRNENIRRMMEATGVGPYAETCGKGHPWSEENTGHYGPSKARVCKTCHRERAVRYRNEKAARDAR